MEQPTLFNDNQLQDEYIDRKIAKTKLSYSSLLIRRPDFQDEELYCWAIVFRKMLGELLLDLYNSKLEATDYLTQNRFKKDRSIICELADIELKHLTAWTNQIIDGAICFDSRQLIDCIRSLADISKDKPKKTISPEEDWGEQTMDKNQLSFEF